MPDDCREDAHRALPHQLIEPGQELHAILRGKQWIDQDGVDFIQDGASSAAALAISSICKDRNKVFIPTSTATSDLTGRACTPNTIHWVYDTYMEARSTGGAMVKAGGDSWFFITPNYAAGIAFQRDTTRFVESNGGKILGGRLYPFPDTSDFSAPLLEAKTSGAKILGIAAWLLMAVAFQPILRFYRVSPLWGLALPAIAATYMAFTLDSAYQHARGRGGMWKGRAQADLKDADVHDGNVSELS